MRHPRRSFAPFLGLITALAVPAPALHAQNIPPPGAPNPGQTTTQPSVPTAIPSPSVTPAPSAIPAPNATPAPGAATAPAPAPGANPNNPQPGGPNNPQMGGIHPGFQAPVKTALDFLEAVKAKDAEALAEVTALRAPTEAATEGHRKFFETVLKKEASVEDLDALAEQFSNYQFMTVQNGKSIARVDVIVGKATRDDQYQRTIHVRKEKAGWKIVDYSGAYSYIGRRGPVRKRAAK